MCIFYCWLPLWVRHNAFSFKLSRKVWKTQIPVSSRFTYLNSARSRNNSFPVCRTFQWREGSGELEFRPRRSRTDHEFPRQLHRNRYHASKSKAFILWRVDLTFKEHLHGIGMVVGILAHRCKRIKLIWKKYNGL